MELYNFEHLDGAILYGIVNDKLRLECKSLEDFLIKFELDKKTFLLKIEDIGCYYDANVNQLRQK